LTDNPEVYVFLEMVYGSLSSVYLYNSMSEKTTLPFNNEESVERPQLKRNVYWALLASLLLLVPLYQFSSHPAVPHFGCNHHSYTAAELASAKCPAQPSAINVGHHWDPNTDEEYAGRAARRLSKAVQVRTESYDDMPLDPTDQRWDKMNAFSEMLEDGFPRVYAALEHEYVNTHGHLFTWKGKDEKLQPILLTAHVDTVPVLQDTLGLWRYPPFEGTITVNGTDDTPGTWIWGRGSSDCKNSLMGILGALERLVTEGHTPERTVVLAFGFDEEIGGPRGAAHLTQAMTDRYGNDSFAFLIDEGFSGLSNDYGAFVLSMGMAEKGSVDVEIKVENPGGHSSVPPAHTGSKSFPLPCVWYSDE
jgi:Gly-Xaa carboxypeptidase